MYHVNGKQIPQYEELLQIIKKWTTLTKFLEIFPNTKICSKRYHFSSNFTDLKM